MPVKKARVAEEIIEEVDGKKERCLIYHDDYIAVKGIKDGTVIDHIRCGQARRIYSRIERMCGLSPYQNVVILQGAPSKTMEFKDKIKIKDYFMSLFRYNKFRKTVPYPVTMSHIKNYEVVLKFRGAKRVNLEDKLD